ncbi:DNRLRE domain-containing protein [Streptomyces sp. NPDC026092]|uniref:CBM96 family carbohydrate-binding protein n=1 Tax=Streptomyces sp. NPDC026092 TaxID=3154797 RepID=UPI0033CDA8C1
MTADVTAALTDATTGAQATDEVAFMLMARHKESSTAQFDSRQNASGGPRLLLTFSDGSHRTVAADADTCIKAGAEKSSVFGTATTLQVRDEGLGAYTDQTRKAYVGFPLDPQWPTVTRATLELTGLNATGTGAKEVVLYQNREMFDESTRTWANTVQNTFSWSGDPGGYTWAKPDIADAEYAE